MSTIPDVCPKCGAARFQPVGYTLVAIVPYDCGAHQNIDPNDDACGEWTRGKDCYERELSTLRIANEDLAKGWEMEREGAGKLREALEAAPSPIVAADSPANYEAPHMVVNFPAIDRWWVVTRSRALSDPTGAAALAERRELEEKAVELASLRESIDGLCGPPGNESDSQAIVRIVNKLDEQATRIHALETAMGAADKLNASACAKTLFPATDITAEINDYTVARQALANPTV